MRFSKKRKHAPQVQSKKDARKVLREAELGRRVTGGSCESAARYYFSCVASTNYKFPCTTAVVPFWGQTSQIPSGLSPKWDCSPKRVETHPKRFVAFLLVFHFSSRFPTSSCMYVCMYVSIARKDGRFRGKQTRNE